MSDVPPSRMLTREIATEIKVEDGFHWPENDGKDVPGWEYTNARSINGEVRRYPVRRVST